jgi:hypothetical protein
MPTPEEIKKKLEEAKRKRAEASTDLELPEIKSNSPKPRKPKESNNDDLNEEDDENDDEDQSNKGNKGRGKKKQCDEIKVKISGRDMLFTKAQLEEVFVKIMDLQIGKMQTKIKTESMKQFITEIKKNPKYKYIVDFFENQVLTTDSLREYLLTLVKVEKRGNIDNVIVEWKMNVWAKDILFDAFGYPVLKNGTIIYGESRHKRSVREMLEWLRIMLPFDEFFRSAIENQLGLFIDAETIKEMIRKIIFS